MTAPISLYKWDVTVCTWVKPTRLTTALEGW
jgi:hypothetical protein